MFFSSDRIWEKMLFFTSAETAQHYLESRYRLLNGTDARKKSYENCYPFIYYIEQGRNFFRQGDSAPITIQPILIFYGFVCLLKACVLAADPDYPRTTRVLAHGVSTRKKKKQNYMYFHDEMIIQKHGLFPHLAEMMFHMGHLAGKKIKISDLLCQIPELSHYFRQLKKMEYIPIKNGDGEFHLPLRLLDVFKMTGSRFQQYLREKTNIPVRFAGEDGSGPIRCLVPAGGKDYPFEFLPFRYDIRLGQYVFCPWNGLSFFPELMIHYLILYHLSMIARYEIEWWSELVLQKTTAEYPVIVQYLQTALQKCPFLIVQYFHYQDDWKKTKQK